MKVVGINGSARKDGNTARLIREVFKELEKNGIETELLQMAGQPVHGCRACYKCFDNKNKRCAITADSMNEFIDKMAAADGIIIGSPTYFANVSAETKALIDRAGMTARANGNMFKRKPGAAVVAVRRAGAIHAFNSINLFFLIGEMVIPGANYWNIGMGRQPGEVESDKEGIETMRVLGANMAWLLKKMG
jgi:multimeric flavodoxin WrbA